MNFIGKLFGSNITPSLSKTERKYRKLVKRPVTDEDIKKQSELEKAIELCAPLAAAHAELYRLSERLRRDEISNDVYLKMLDLLMKKIAVKYQDRNAFIKFVGATASIEDFTTK